MDFKQNNLHASIYEGAIVTLGAIILKTICRIISGHRSLNKKSVMNQGKILLGMATLFVTVASSLAFKTGHKFIKGHKLHVQVTLAGVNFGCVTCWSVRTTAASRLKVSSCRTSGHFNNVAARNGRTYFTVATASNVNCTHPWTKVTKSL
jgi:hypothetical protein